MKKNIETTPGERDSKDNGKAVGRSPLGLHVTFAKDLEKPTIENDSKSTAVSTKTPEMTLNGSNHHLAAPLREMLEQTELTPDLDFSKIKPVPKLEPEPDASEFLECTTAATSDDEFRPESLLDFLLTIEMSVDDRQQLNLLRAIYRNHSHNTYRYADLKDALTLLKTNTDMETVKHLHAFMRKLNIRRAVICDTTHCEYPEFFSTIPGRIQTQLMFNNEFYLSGTDTESSRPELITNFELKKDKEGRVTVYFKSRNIAFDQAQTVSHTGRTRGIRQAYGCITYRGNTEFVFSKKTSAALSVFDQIYFLFNKLMLTYDYIFNHAIHPFVAILAAKPARIRQDLQVNLTALVKKAHDYIHQLSIRSFRKLSQEFHIAHILLIFQVFLDYYAGDCREASRCLEDSIAYAVQREIPCERERSTRLTIASTHPLYYQVMLQILVSLAQTSQNTDLIERFTKFQTRASLTKISPEMHFYNCHNCAKMLNDIRSTLPTITDPRIKKNIGNQLDFFARYFSIQSLDYYERNRSRLFTKPAEVKTTQSTPTKTSHVI